MILDWTDEADPALADGAPGAGFAGYDVEIATDAVFSAVVFAGSPAASNDIVPLSPGTYWRRIRSRDAIGNASALSSPSQFTAPTPGAGFASAMSGGGGGGGHGCSFAFASGGESPVLAAFALLALLVVRARCDSRRT